MTAAALRLAEAFAAALLIVIGLLVAILGAITVASGDDQAYGLLQVMAAYALLARAYSLIVRGQA